MCDRFRDDTERGKEYIADNTDEFEEQKSLYICFRGDCYLNSEVLGHFGSVVVDNWKSKMGVYTQYMTCFTLQGDKKDRKENIVEHASRHAARHRKLREWSTTTQKCAMTVYHANANHWFPVIFLVSLRYFLPQPLILSCSV